MRCCRASPTPRPRPRIRAGPAAPGVRSYDISSQERIVRGRMPNLEIINERFARNIRLGFFNLIHKSAEISIGGVKVQKYSAFLREIVVPTNFNIMSVRPLRGSGLIVCDPSLVFAVVDALSAATASCMRASRDASSRPPSSASSSASSS
jgi:flagellar motor switch protein FliM